MVQPISKRRDIAYGSINTGQPAIVHQHGNLSWSQDGQCLVLVGRKACIFTPYPPSNLPKQTSGGAEDDESAGSEAEGQGNKPTEPSLSQPMPLFHTFIEIHGAQQHAAAGSRVGTSGESDFWDQLVARTGDGTNPLPGETEGSMVTYERSRYYRAGSWSPSGLGRLGGCVVALLSSDLEVVVHEPRRDHTHGKYQQICALSRQMADTILSNANPKANLASSKGKGKGRERLKPPPIDQVLMTRSHCIAWSEQVYSSTPSMFGVDGSLLAVGNRAGGISLWKHVADGQRMNMLAHELYSSSWILDLAWSQWQQISDTESTAHLTFVDSEHDIFDTIVRRSVNATQDGWDLKWSTPVLLDDDSDGRSVTALKWIDETLVWTKPGTVHLRSPAWDGIRELRVARVGDWAGCNSLERCVGIQSLKPSSLVIVLASLTYHLIRDVSTNPHFAPPAESLSASKVARKVMLARRVPEAKVAPERTITASTAAWAGLDDWAGIACWVAEPMELHDLSYRSEKDRNSVFCMANQHAELATGDEVSLIDRVEQTMDSPPSCLTTSPNKVTLPWILNIMHSLEPEAATAAVLAICSKPGQAVLDGVPEGSLLRVLFDDPAVDRWRLQYVLARWCATRGSDPSVADELEDRISRWATSRIISWLDTMCDTSQRIGAQDQTFLAVQAARAGLALLPDKLRAALGGDTPIEACPACSQPVLPTGKAGREGVCASGHLWSRCSVTQLLLTSHIVRICSTCCARALVPCTSTAADGWMSAAVLRAARVCIGCGGRWIEST